MGVHAILPDLKVNEFTVKADETNTKREFGPINFGDDTGVILAPHLGFAMPVGNKLSFGIAAYGPYGLEVEWEDDPAKNPAAYNAYHSYYMRKVLSPTFGYKVNDKFSVGYEAKY